MCLLQMVRLIIDVYIAYCVSVLIFYGISLMRCQQAVDAVKLRWLSTPDVVCSIYEVLPL